MDFNFKYPTLELHNLRRKAKTPKEKEILRKFLVENNMLTIYKHLISQNVLQENKHDLNKIKEEQETKLAKFYKLKEKDADNTAVIKSHDLKIAELHAKFMNTEECLEIMRVILRNESSLSLQIDVYLCKIRFAILLKNKKMLEENIKLARDVSDHGCDWDRRNKFKIYDAIYNLKKGNFKETAELLSEALPSFEKNEVVELKDAVEYLVFAGLLSMDRANINKCLLECPDVLMLGCQESISLVKSLYECNYIDFLPNLYKYLVSINNDYYLMNFIDYFCKEMKIKIYKQLLDSYRSINLQNMSSIFGIEVEYLENDLQVYIAEKRLQIKINKVLNTIVRYEEELNKFEENIAENDKVLSLIQSQIN